MSTAPYYVDESVTLWLGDALTVLTSLPNRSVDCCVTSPPYFGLRDYGVDGQLGLEASPAQYVEKLRAIFAQVRRVLADDGTCWLNLGDSYSTHQRGSDKGWDKSRLSNPARVQKMQFAALRDGRHLAFDRPEKNLMGIPWRVAFELQDDGWILRNDIIWAKPNGMPESVTDRLTSKHEHLFLLTKSPQYWFDLDPIREPHAEVSVARSGRNRFAVDRSQEGVGSPQTADPSQAIHLGGKNPGDVWNIPTQPFAAAHFAVMPLALADRAVQAGCRPGGTVLDPFSGSGTTGLAAARHGRRYVGIDLNAEYLDLSLQTRLRQPGLTSDNPDQMAFESLREVPPPPGVNPRTGEITTTQGA